MVKFAAFFITSALLISLTGCAGTFDFSANKQGDNRTIGCYELDIVSCETARDYKQNDIAIITYSFTNHSEHSVLFMEKLDDRVFQNGVQLATAFYKEKSVDYLDKTKEVPPGSSLEFKCAYTMIAANAPIKVEVSSYPPSRQQRIEQVFHLT